MDRDPDRDLPPERAGAGAPGDAPADPPAGEDVAAEPTREDFPAGEQVAAEPTQQGPPAGQDLAGEPTQEDRPGHDPTVDELAFLERSLADLDAEKSAGDISDADYRTLTGVYADRVRAVRRRVAGGGGRRPTRNWRRPLAILVIVAMLATGVGIGLASALGHRSSVDTATGDIRQSSRGMLFEAQEHIVEGRWDEAEELYAAVLAAEPSSAEALAWWGWLDLQRGRLESAATRLAEAVAADPLYPEARVFGAIVAFRLGRLDEASAHLEAFDGVDPPPLMVELVENSELRQRILASRIAEAETAGDTAAIEVMLATASPDDMAIAARHLADGGRVVLAARLFGSALQADPANVAALVGRGALLTSPDFAAFEDLLAEGLAALDRAVELAPDNPEARFWRALAAARTGRLDDALADLDHLATLDAPPGLLAEAARLADEVRAAAANA